MDVRQQECCGLSVLSMCTGVAKGLGRHGQGEGEEGFSWKRGRKGIGEKGHCSLSSPKLRLFHCWKRQSWWETLLNPGESCEGGSCPYRTRGY